MLVDHPQHIAIIMDGNGRWATAKNMPRTYGHKQGAKAVRRVVEAAADNNVKYLTLFGFSSENWQRPEEEVVELMNLLRQYLRSETAELHKSGACLKVIGNREKLDSDIVDLIESAEKLTAENQKITLIIALNYGGRDDILRAAYRTPKNQSFECFKEEFESNISTQGIPDPDILIRTGGEKRISNFLIWQCAYTELFFTDAFWPDFDKNNLEEAIADFHSRERRFGKIPKQAKL